MSDGIRQVALVGLPTSMLHDMAVGLIAEMMQGKPGSGASLECIVDELAERATKGEHTEFVEERYTPPA